MISLLLPPKPEWLARNPCAVLVGISYPQLSLCTACADRKLSCHDEVELSAGSSPKRPERFASYPCIIEGFPFPNSGLDCAYSVTPSFAGVAAQEEEMTEKVAAMQSALEDKKKDPDQLRLTERERES